MAEQEWWLHKAFASSEFVRSSATQFGFAANQENSAQYPTTNMTWLEINLDFDNKIFSIPDKRIFSISTTNNKNYSITSFHNCSNVS